MDELTKKLPKGKGINVKAIKETLRRIEKDYKCRKCGRFDGLCSSIEYREGFCDDCVQEEMKVLAIKSLQDGR